MTESYKIFGKYNKNSPEWEEVRFLAHQLGVLDTKAHNIITIDAVLIVIATLTSLFEAGIDEIIQEIAAVATIGILISVGLCIKTVYTKWATTFPSKYELEKFRDIKTKYLHMALVALVLSLGLYISVLMLGVVDSYVDPSEKLVDIQIVQRLAEDSTLLTPDIVSQSIAVCKEDEIPTGGGYIGGNKDFTIIENKKYGEQGWLVQGTYQSENTDTSTQFRAFVQCATIST